MIEAFERYGDTGGRFPQPLHHVTVPRPLLEEFARPENVSRSSVPIYRDDGTHLELSIVRVR